MHSLTSIVIPYVLVLFVTGCASTPVRYYTLSAATESAAECVNRRPE